MRNFLKLAFVIIAFTSMLPATAATYDAEGYPEVYLRGTMNQWNASRDYKFTREGNKYSLYVANLQGTFKIGDANWDRVDYGTSQGLKITTRKTAELTWKGSNINAEVSVPMLITFELVKDEKPQLLSVTFETEGIKPPKPSGMSNTLPVLYVNVYKVDTEGNFITNSNGDKTFENEILSKDLNHKNYFKGEYWLDINGCQWMADLGAKSVGSEEAPLPLQIKARGNWTLRGFAKKPFKLKLDKKQNLLGLTPDKSKHYCILAHADDNYGFLRNFTGFNVSERIGLPWTPAQQPIEVVINGDYRGLYFLTESIRVGDGRVDIEELEDYETNSELISGGYIVEFDNYEEDNQIRLDEKTCVSGHIMDKLRITFQSPENYSDIMTRFVREQFTTMNNLVGSNFNDMWKYLDLDDLARFYIVQEVLTNVESFHGSTYLFRKRGEGQKWHFSPVWDFGQSFNGPTNGFFYDHDPYGNTWIPSIRKNSKFNEKVRQTWQWFMGNRYEGLIEDIDEYVEHISEAAKADGNRWRNTPKPNSGVSVVDNSDMRKRRDSVVNFLNSKTSWISSKFGQPVKGMAEPARDTTAAAPLPAYATTGIEDIIVDQPSDAEAQLYDLTGRKVTNPTPGIYIKVSDNKASKILIK